MSLKGNNFFRHNKHGVALLPEVLNNSSQNGPAIEEPWRDGRAITFILSGGAFAASASVLVGVELQQRSDDAWVAMKEGALDPNDDLEFDVQADGGTLENGSVIGTIDMNDIDGQTYKAIRLTAAESGTADAPIAAGYVISDLYEMLQADATTLDDLWTKAKYGIV